MMRHVRATSSTRQRAHRSSIRALCLAVCLGAPFGCSGKTGAAKAESGKSEAAATKSDANPDTATAAGKGDDKADEKAGEPAVSHAEVTASVITVGESTFSETVTGSGVVSPRVGHLASLSAPAPTRVTAVHVAVGDRVARGADLVSFETVTFDAAVASADAALNAAELAAARAKRLVEAGVSPRKDAELANSELAAARSVSVGAHRAQQLAKLTSPIAGVVTRLSAVLGANVDVGQVLVDVTDTGALDVQLFFSPSAVANVRRGQSVTFREDAAADASPVAEGKVADVSAVVDSASRGVMVRVAVQAAKRTLRLGESVYGDIPTASHAKAIVIPDDALVPTGEGFRVFVVDSANTAHARPVTVGARTAHRVWISSGLKAGETIVTTGAYGMDDGAAVVTKKTPQP